MFKKTPEQMELIQRLLDTPLSETGRWSCERYMVINTRISLVWNAIAEIITIPLQIVAAIPLLGLPFLLLLTLFGLLWTLLLHLITLPFFLVTGLLVGGSSARRDSVDG